MNESTYIDREVGQYPLSSGTSLALEGLFGIHPKQPPRPGGYKAIRTLWVNLRTLIRNLHAAMPSEQAKRIALPNAALVIADEARVLPEVIRQQHLGIEVVFYYSDLDEVRWLFPNAVYKKPKTERQFAYDHYERTVLSIILTHLRDQAMPVQAIKRQPASTPTVAALLTHYPHELFWRTQFDRLFLLESHTGKLKMYNHWYTKLHGITDATPLPFNPYTLQVFGDNLLFEPQPRGIRAELKDLAEVRRWTAITAMEKMQGDIAKYGSQELRSNYALLIG